MTTSLSNASTAAGLQEREPATTPTATAATAPPESAEAGSTTASRFIILTLCLALTLSTLAFGTVHSWTIAFFQLGAALVVVLWAADAWRTRALRLSRNVLQWPLVGLFIVGLFQLLPLRGGGESIEGLSVEPVQALSLDPYATRFVLIQLAALFIYFAATLVFINSPRRLRLLVHVLLIFGFLLALYGLLQYFVNPQQIYWLRQPSQAIPFGPFVNRHHFAACMEMLLAVPLGLLFAGAIESDRRLLYFFSVALMSIALVMTGSRGGILSLAVEILFIVSLAGITRRKKREAEATETGGTRVRAALLRAALGLALVLGLLGSALFFGGEESLSRLVGTVNSDDPTSGRAQFWRGTLGVIKEYPFLGAGLGAFHVAYTQHDPLTGLFRLEQAHNDYLQILADAGIVGGALGLFFIVALFRTGLRRTQSADKFRRGVAMGALAGCFAVLVHSFFDFPLHVTSNALLFLTLAALSTLNGRVEDESIASRGKRRRHRHGQHARRQSAASKAET
ncbi:MAG: O-antigen ligase family protein [Acidobacteriota bacterium]|nr:O-antigen ligase family protein [Acidobacteriota bacterium]